MFSFCSMLHKIHYVKFERWISTVGAIHRVEAHVANLAKRLLVPLQESLPLGIALSCSQRRHSPCSELRSMFEARPLAQDSESELLATSRARRVVSQASRTLCQAPETDPVDLSYPPTDDWRTNHMLHSDVNFRCHINALSLRANPCAAV